MLRSRAIPSITYSMSHSSASSRESFLGSPEWESKHSNSNDQPILIYLVWSGALDEAKLPYRFGGCDSGFMTIQWCVVNHQINYDEHGRVLSPSGSVPAYLHQYPRIESHTKEWQSNQKMLQSQQELKKRKRIPLNHQEVK